MGAEVGALHVKFGADLAELQKGIAQVQSLISTQITKGLQQASKASNISGAAIKRNFSDVGRGIQSVGLLLGGTQGQFILLASVAVSEIGSVGKALTGILGGPITLTIAAIAALGAAVVLVATNFDDFKQIVTKVWNYIVQYVSDAIGFLIDLLKEIPIVSDLVGDSFDGIRVATKYWSAEAKQNIIVINATIAAQERLKAQTKAVTEAHDKYTKAIARAGDQEKLFGESSETVRARISAVKDAMAALAKEGMSTLTEQGARNLKSLATLADQLAVLKNRLLEVEAAEKAVAQQRALDQARIEEGIPLADRLISPETMTVLAERQAEISQQFAVWVQDLKVTTGDFLLFAQDVFTQFSQGFGDAVAAAIVYGEDLGKSLKNLLKQVSANIISTLVQLAIQQIIFAAIGKKLTAAKGAQEIAVATAAAAAWTVVAAIRELGLAGLAASPALATAAIGITTGAAIAGGAAGAATGAGIGIAGVAERGALVTGPALMLVGEGNQHEVIAPRSEYEKVMQGGGGTQHLNVYLDGQVITRAVIRGMPSEVRIEGVKGL